MTFINASCVTIKRVSLLCVTVKSRMFKVPIRKRYFIQKVIFLFSVVKICRPVHILSEGYISKVTPQNINVIALKVR